MRPSYPDRQRHSPTHSPAWRRERALALVDAGRYGSRKRDDEETARAVAYLRALRRGQGGRQQAGVARSFPDVHAARQLNLHGGDATVEVQARLLAAQSFEEVARITGLSPEVVRWYEA